MISANRLANAIKNAMQEMSVRALIVSIFIRAGRLTRTIIMNADKLAGGHLQDY